MDTEMRLSSKIIRVLVKERVTSLRSFSLDMRRSKTLSAMGKKDKALAMIYPHPLMLHFTRTEKL